MAKLWQRYKTCDLRVNVSRSSRFPFSIAMRG